MVQWEHVVERRRAQVERQVRVHGEPLLLKTKRGPKTLQTVELFDRIKLPQQCLKVKFRVRG